MQYKKAWKYDTKAISARFMGPNPLKLTEELLIGHRIPDGATVLDLGCGRGLTSLFLAKEYGFLVFATDLWIDATENRKFFDEQGLTATQVVPIHAEATALPYAKEFFDAVVCVDAYHYFGRERAYLETDLLPYVRRGGHIYICVPGMKQDCHDNLPPELLRFWTSDQLESIHDATYWENLIGQSAGIRRFAVREMEGTQEAWDDWLECDNEYAREDRKAMEAGAGSYLNFLAITVQKQ